jgi:hypothetical protein
MLILSAPKADPAQNSRLARPTSNQFRRFITLSSFHSVRLAARLSFASIYLEDRLRPSVTPPDVAAI